jgi:hypothetical protein
MPGPEFERYRSIVPAGALPGVAVEPRDGRVVSVGGAFASAAGQLLARATARTHQHPAVTDLLGGLAACASEHVAVLALSRDLADLEDWPGRTGACVGVLVGRTEASLACLVYRSLTVAIAHRGPHRRPLGTASGR